MVKHWVASSNLVCRCVFGSLWASYPNEVTSIFDLHFMLHWLWLSFSLDWFPQILYGLPLSRMACRCILGGLSAPHPLKIGHIVKQAIVSSWGMRRILQAVAAPPVYFSVWLHSRFPFSLYKCKWLKFLAALFNYNFFTSDKRIVQK